MSKNPKNKFGERKAALAGMDIKKKNKKIPMGGQNAPCVFAKGGGGGLNA